MHRDAALVDCDNLKGAVPVVQGLRSSASNKNSVTFAILDGDTTTLQAFQMGANFVLQKPISALNAKRRRGAAINFMIREQRRYFRPSLKLFIVPNRPSPTVPSLGLARSHPARSL